MAFTTLYDGGLSVRIGGVERRSVVNELEWDSTNQGDGAGSFWVEVANPHNPQAQYPELVHGAPVIVDHTYAGLTTRLYTGYVVSDPRRGVSTDVARVDVECAGPLEVAKSRDDMAFVYTDNEPSIWFANKKSPHCFGFDNGGRIAVTVGDNVKVPHDKAGMIGAVAYLGATHLFKGNGGPLSGFKRITATASWNLKDNLRASLVWWPAYRTNLDVSDYHVIATWTGTEKARTIDLTFGGADGAGYVALAVFSDKSGGTKTTDERFFELEGVTLYTDVAQKRIDQAMLHVAQLIGLATSYDTAEIGSLLASLVVRPSTDPASALAQLAAQATDLVEWGWWGGVFRARPLETDPNVIHTLPNCYRVDAGDGDILWDVALRPETGTPRSVRLLYGSTAQSAYPPGTPAQVIAPNDPGWASGVPYAGITAPVLTVDFSQRNRSTVEAKSIATKLAQRLGVGEAEGTVGIRCPEVPLYRGSTRPAPYMHGGDWIEAQQGGAGPLYITRAHVVAETGYVDLDVGLSSEQLIEQLEGIGAIKPVALHKPHKKQRR